MLSKRVQWRQEDSQITIGRFWYCITVILSYILCGCIAELPFWIWTLLNCFIHESKRFSQPYLSRIVAASEPHLSRASVVLEPYMRPAASAWRSLVSFTSEYHHQVQAPTGFLSRLHCLCVFGSEFRCLWTHHRRRAGSERSEALAWGQWAADASFSFSWQAGMDHGKFSCGVCNHRCCTLCSPKLTITGAPHTCRRPLCWRCRCCPFTRSSQQSSGTQVASCFFSWQNNIGFGCEISSRSRSCGSAVGKIRRGRTDYKDRQAGADLVAASRNAESRGRA